MKKIANKNAAAATTPAPKTTSTPALSSSHTPTSAPVSASARESAKDLTPRSRPIQKSKMPRLIAISAAVLGLATLTVGIVILVLNLTAQPAVLDADFLVSVGRWRRDDAASVVWDFTEIGKGTLTTNSHTNDYPFLWSITDNTLNLETTWLYALNDSYFYNLDQSTSTLTLTSGDDSYVFRPVAPLTD